MAVLHVFDREHPNALVHGHLWVPLRHSTGPQLVVSFLRGKARRLLFPFFSVSVATYLARSWGSDELGVDVWWHIFVYRFEQFWFLPAIMWVFVLVAALERLRWLDRKSHIGFAIVLAVVARTVLPPVEVLNLDGFIYLLPFFLVGCTAARFADDQDPLVMKAAIGAAVVGLMMQQAVWFGAFDFDVGRDSIIGTVIGLSVGYVLLRYRFHIPTLARLGSYAFPIYLFHIFGVGAAARLSVAVGNEQAWLDFLLKVLIGVVVSIAAERLVHRSGVLSTAVLGLRVRVR